MRTTPTNKAHSRRTLGFGLGAAFFLAATSASAATILVDSTVDPGAIDGNCSLREAVLAANTNAVVDGCAAGDAAPVVDVINFSDSVTYPLTASELAITEAVSFNEGGQTPTIDAQNMSRIFTNTAALTLTDLTLVNGNADGVGNPANSGGAILNSVGGTLTVNGGAMNNNNSTRAGGAIEDNANGGPATITLNNVSFTGNTTGGAPGNGGVLHISGTSGVVISGGSFTSNVAANEGGALWNGSGLMDISGTVLIDGNTARGSAVMDPPVQGVGGGGIFNEGGVLIIAAGTTITNNSAPGDLPAATPPAPSQGSGGGILNNSGTVTITGAVISNNSAVRAGGGIEDNRRENGGTTTVTLNNVTMDGNSTGSSPGNGGAVHVSGGGGTFMVNGGSFTNNTAANEGGGLWNFGGATMNIDGATIRGNAGNGTGAANGGGGLFNNGGTLNVLNSVIDDNDAIMGSGSGGGILNSDGGVLAVTDSTISNNTANRAGGGIETRGGTGNQVTLTSVFLTANVVNTSPGNGGGLHAGADGNVNVTNSIVSNNQAGLEGGGLWVMNGALNVSGSRISGNQGLGDRDAPSADNLADGGGGGIVVNGSSTATISGNTLIAQNTANGAQGSGGGIFNKANGTVIVMDSVIAGNSADRAGGGIENDGGNVTLTRITLGGADSSTGNMTGNAPGNGGGLHTGGAGVVTVDDSSVGYNTAAEGGGLWNSGAGSLTVNNSTVSNNVATTRTGGGIHQDGDGGSTVLNFVTVAQNSAAGNGGGVAVPGNSTATANSSIIAGNSTDATDANRSGGVTAASSVVDMDARLGQYRLFGGTTATHRLLAGSPALNSADQAACIVAPIDGADQRAADRPVTCDAGAFEAAGNPLVQVTNNNRSIITVPSAGDTGVTILDFTLSNNSGGSLTIDGVSGVVDASVPGIEPSNFQVFANGSASPLNGASVTVDGRSFTVTFSGPNGVVFDDGDSASYTVTADFNTGNSTASLATPVFAGGMLLGLLGLFSVGGLRRRTQWALLAIAMAVGLAACGGGSNGDIGDIFNPGDNQPPAPADLRFIAVTVDGEPGATNDFIVGDGMPVNGPGINFGS